MAKSINCSSQRKFTTVYPSLLLIFFLSLWIQCTPAITVKTIAAPEVICGISEHPLMHHCPHGGYIKNPNPRKCEDQYICYRGPGETCNENDEMQCRPELSCQCHICQNCTEKNCKMELCSRENSILKKWIKRFERNLLEYN